MSLIELSFIGQQFLNIHPPFICKISVHETVRLSTPSYSYKLMVNEKLSPKLGFEPTIYWTWTSSAINTITNFFFFQLKKIKKLKLDFDLLILNLIKFKIKTTYQILNKNKNIFGKLKISSDFLTHISKCEFKDFFHVNYNWHIKHFQDENA